MEAIEGQLQAVEDALFDTVEGSKEHKKLTVRYECLKEEKKFLLTQGGRPPGSHVGAAITCSTWSAQQTCRLHLETVGLLAAATCPVAEADSMTLSAFATLHHGKTQDWAMLSD